MSEFPTVPIPNTDNRLPIEYIAGMVGLKSFYDGHYRIYSQYTHGALRASTGILDEATDPEDNRIMTICALIALDNLRSFGAESTNRGRLAERLLVRR